MHLGKKLSGTILATLLLFDSVIAYRFFDQGWPKYAKAGSDDTMRVVRVPFTWEDGLFLVGVAALHVLAIYAFRKSSKVAHL